MTGDSVFLDFEIKPAIIVALLALWLIAFPLKIRFFFFGFCFGVWLAMVGPGVETRYRRGCLGGGQVRGIPFVLDLIDGHRETQTRNYMDNKMGDGKSRFKLTARGWQRLNSPMLVWSMWAGTCRPHSEIFIRRQMRDAVK